MREILFRGKRKDKPTEWVYGYLIGSFTPSSDAEIQTWITEGYYKTHYEVIPETVGQLTLLNDKNEKGIWEGDIVKFHYFYQSLGANLGAQESEHELVGVIKMMQYGWGVSAIKGQHWQGYTGYDAGEGESSIVDLYCMNESSLHEESFDIIGDIYTTPELLNPIK